MRCATACGRLHESGRMTLLACSCGKVEYEATEPAILAVVCYCDDCQEGGRRIEALPNAPPVLEADGGTSCVLYRKDRVRCTHGADLVTRLKLRDKTATNRLVATCCNSALAMSFDDAKHWMPLFRARLHGKVRRLDMRICTKFAPDPARIPQDVPAHESFAFSFIWKLLGARFAMMLGR